MSSELHLAWKISLTCKDLSDIFPNDLLFSHMTIMSYKESSLTDQEELAWAEEGI